MRLTSTQGWLSCSERSVREAGRWSINQSALYRLDYRQITWRLISVIPSEAPRISVFFVTLNESRTIGEAVRSVASLDEVIVVDSGSTDDTVNIARQEGARVIQKEWAGFSKQKSYAMGLCRNEWCFNLDGDEVVPSALLDEILVLVSSGEWDLIRLQIEDIFMGAPMHLKSRKRKIIRVFRKSLVSYPDQRQVHENLIGSGKTITTSERLIHWGYNDLGVYATKQMRYARLRAIDKQKSGIRASGFKLLAIFPITFLKVYLFRGLWWSGRRGIVQSAIEAFYSFMKEAYLMDIQRESEMD